MHALLFALEGRTQQDERPHAYLAVKQELRRPAEVIEGHPLVKRNWLHSAWQQQKWSIWKVARKNIAEE